MNITFKKLERALDFIRSNDIYNKKQLFLFLDNGRTPKWRFSFTAYSNTYFFVTTSPLESRLFRLEFFSCRKK